MKLENTLFPRKFPESTNQKQYQISSRISRKIDSWQVVTPGLMGYEQAKLRGAARYVSWVVTRTLSLTTRQSARRDPYGRLPDALGMCDDLRWAGRSAASLYAWLAGIIVGC